MMQRFESINREIQERFREYKKQNPQKMEARLKFAWSNWGFGMEELERSVERLASNGIAHIELHGNHYGPDMGYDPHSVQSILKQYPVSVSGICGMFSAHNDLSSAVPIYRQNAIDYIRRTVLFAKRMGAGYMLVVPAAVGRPEKYDDFEVDRSIETLRIVADEFVGNNVRAAIEPIRSAEVSIIHTFDEAQEYIRRVDHEGVQHINGDIYHMLCEERHAAQRILQAGERMINLHLADTNRRALGEGSLDLDTLMMALYLVGYNNGQRFCTAEPLGPGGDPYPAMYGKPDRKELDELVRKTITTWNEREEHVRSL